MTQSRTLTIILVSTLTLGWALGAAARAAETDPTKAAAAFIEALGVEVQAIQATAPPRRAALRGLIRGGFDLDGPRGAAKRPAQGQGRDQNDG